MNDRKRITILAMAITGCKSSTWSTCQRLKRLAIYVSVAPSTKTPEIPDITCYKA